MSTIGLSQAIKELRDELATAQAEGKDHGIRIEIVEAEVELLLEAHEEGAGKAGVSFGVVSLGADGKVGRTNTHRITLKLALTGADGKNTRVSSRNGVRRDDDEGSAR
ncbi:trypco2 family protein [Nocardiopsis deserti]|uniref:trypco2 family protein n=1 Tax=Nocardiopsis deserti TaxID=2605988 RepID=UPI00123A7B00|nr:trypco2 family protein [Nocardiopsis deserti]